MIYYDNKMITVRDMELSDGRIFTDEENKQGWNTTVDKFEMRINDRKEAISLTVPECGIRIRCVHLMTRYILTMTIWCFICLRN